jgi:hypothetical protein
MVVNPYNVVTNHQPAMNMNKDLSQKLPLAKKDINSPVGAPRNRTTKT